MSGPGEGGVERAASETHSQQRAIDRVLASQPALDWPRKLRVQKRLGWLVTLVVVLFLLGEAAVFVARMRVPRLGAVMPWLMMGQSVFVLGAFLWVRHAVRKAVRRLVVPHGGFVCLRCHYPLTACEERGQCPECGTFYSRELVVRAWRSAHGLGELRP